MPFPTSLSAHLSDSDCTAEHAYGPRHAAAGAGLAAADKAAGATSPSAKPGLVTELTEHNMSRIVLGVHPWSCPSG